VVDILLGAGGAVARGQETTGGGGEETSLQASCLCVVIMTIAIALRYVLENNPPVTLNIHSSGDLYISRVRGAQ